MGVRKPLIGSTLIWVNIFPEVTRKLSNTYLHLECWIIQIVVYAVHT